MGIQGNPDRGSPEAREEQAPKSWRPIVLRETLGKVVEPIIAVRIRDFAESGGLILMLAVGSDALWYRMIYQESAAGTA